jgi:hypothetical protein
MRIIEPTDLYLSGRPEVRALPPLPAATWVWVESCPGLSMCRLAVLEKRA